MASEPVTVEVDGDALPPAPNWALVTQWRARCQLVGAKATGPPPPDTRATGTQHVVLHTRTGQLTFHAADWRDPAPIPGACTRQQWEAYFGPGAAFCASGEPDQWATPVPDLLRWVIDSGVPERPYLTASQAHAFLDSLVPLAEDLIDHLQPVAGTAHRDWSPRSASAGLDIQLACRRDTQPRQGQRPYLISMDQAVSALPTLVRPQWAELNPEALAAEAELITRFGVGQHPVLHTLFDGHAGQGPLQILGARAWIFAHRARMNGAKPTGTATPARPD